MFKAFCYCCKQHIETTDENEFHKAGHVNEKNEAKHKYNINTKYTPKDVK